MLAELGYWIPERHCVNCGFVELEQFLAVMMATK